MTRVERTEVLDGLRATRRYVLSHHEPPDWDRCYTIELPWRDRPGRLCARCSGIYPGVVLGVFLATRGLLPVSLPLIALLPAFAVGERLLERETDYGGWNPLRSGTGLLLGAGYGLGLLALTDPPRRLGVIAVGVAYAAVALAILAEAPPGLPRHRSP